MVMRICPACQSEQYSADAEGTWKCGKCGGKIPPEAEPGEGGKEKS